MALGWLLAAFIFYYAKPIIIVGLAGLMIFLAYKRNKRRWVWKVMAISLPALLALEVIIGNLELEKLCSREAGVHVYAKAPGTTTVFLDRYASVGTFTALGYVQSVERDFNSGQALSSDTNSGFYRYTLGKRGKSDCLSKRSPRGFEDQCLVVTDIPEPTSRYRITRHLGPEGSRDKDRDLRNWRTPNEMYIIDRESNDIIGVAKQFDRRMGWSWSGVDVFFPEMLFIQSASPVTGPVLQCPEGLWMDLQDELFRSVFMNSSGGLLEREDWLDLRKP